MLVRIVLLFYTYSVSAADNVNQYSSNQQGYAYEPQRCLGGYCSQMPQFPASFTDPGYQQYFQRQDTTYRNIQQAERRPCLHNNPQQYANQPQQYVNDLQRYVNQQPQYVNQETQYVNQPQTNLNHQQQYVNQQQQYVNEQQQFVNQQQQYANQQPQYVNQPQLNLNQQQQYANQQQQFLNEQQQYANQQAQFVTQPQQSASRYFYDKPTSPPTSSTSSGGGSGLSGASGLSAPAFIQNEDNSQANRISEKKCYETYFMRGSGFVSGGDKANVGEFPYMAAIGYSKPTGGYDYQCGGTLISSNFILTAAHCRTANGQRAAVARIGGARLDDNSPQNQPKEITDIMTPTNYRRRQVYNDIALLKLKDAVSNVDPACLWTQNTINYNTATAIGYGQTGFGLSTSTDLLKVDLQLYSSQVCQQYYTPRFRLERGLVDTQVCAGDFNKVKDTCPGDSGGPLLARTQARNREVPFILGVTSFGPGCAEGIPGIYTKVASYLDWLEPIVWPGE